MAHAKAEQRGRRSKPTKLGSNQELHAEVATRLRELWSPEQISRTLERDFPDRPEMQVSHETIYQALYVQGRGQLRRELSRCLRTGRAVRRPRRLPDQRKKRTTIPDTLLISHRPAEAEDRVVPGHWEGDLIIGKDSGSAIGTLVERSSRFVMLLHLPGQHGAEQVRDAMITTMRTLPEAIRRSLTRDQGKELTRHAEITFALDLPIYFCDPHSPWQRGSNENTNGLLRQYHAQWWSLMPGRGGTTLAVDTSDDSGSWRRRHGCGTAASVKDTGLAFNSCSLACRTKASLATPAAVTLLPILRSLYRSPATRTRPCHEQFYKSLPRRR